MHEAKSGRKRYDLRQLLEEIREDEKVVESRPDYWASQDDINDMVQQARKGRGKAK
ncbi:MAG: hypothetical protein AB1413_11145 [Thermodesulfobacteriota bacterium]